MLQISYYSKGLFGNIKLALQFLNSGVGTGGFGVGGVGVGVGQWHSRVTKVGRKFG